MNREICMLAMDDEKAIPGSAGLASNVSDAFDHIGAEDAHITEFQVPWLNAQGKIKMIQAYLC